MKQLSSENLGVLRLDLAIDDHLRLITDVSLQLSDPKELAQALCIDDTQFARISHDCKNYAEKIFLLLHSWVCENRVMSEVAYNSPVHPWDPKQDSSCNVMYVLKTHPP